MATLSDLAPRVLRKLTVLEPNEAAQAEDLLTAQEKLKAVHYALKAKGMLRWTLQDIPDYAEEPYVAMAAFLAGPDYTKAVPVDQWEFGIVQIREGNQLESCGPVTAEYF